MKYTSYDINLRYSNYIQINLSTFVNTFKYIYKSIVHACLIEQPALI